MLAQEHVVALTEKSHNFVRLAKLITFFQKVLLHYIWYLMFDSEKKKEKKTHR